ncbi:MAG: TolC family protein [Planctomycetaceae bacterium]
MIRSASRGKNVPIISDDAAGSRDSSSFIATDGPVRTSSTDRRLPLQYSPIAALLVVLLLVMLAPGCRQHARRKHYLGAEHPAPAVAHMTEIEYPDVIQPTSAEVTMALEPRRLRNLNEDLPWDLSLQDAVYMALCNSKLIRSSATFLSPSNPLLNNPEAVPSVYDSALQESGVLFGRRGVEAALSEFDAQFTTSMIWGRNETIQNNLFNSGGLRPGSTLQEDTANFNTSITKRLATGAQFGVSHQWNYSLNNQPGRLFPSVYEGNMQAVIRQPLLAGSGVDYTRIAGPVSENIQGVTGVGQGVLIARINNDMALADFEQGVHNLLRDVETLYWQLVQAYQTFDEQATSRDQILELWRKMDARLAGGAAGGGRLPEVELRESYVQQVAAADAALDAIYSTEAQLRRLLGLGVNDGRVIRPADTPVTAEVVPDWVASLSSALSQRPELRRQKWSIKSVQLQLAAAQNLTLPRLDFIAAAQANGFGDRLIGPHQDPTGSNLGDAYDRLFSGKHTGWNVGIEYSTPLGRRYAHAQQRNLELQLAKAREGLQQQEIEISHELAAAFRDVDRTYLALTSAYNRIAAAEDRLQVVLESTLPDDLSLEPLLRAYQQRSQAKLSYITSLAEYNTALADVHYRSARTLEINSISLREGAWNDEAQQDAAARRKADRHAFPNPFVEDSIPPFAVSHDPGHVHVPSTGLEPTSPTPLERVPESAEPVPAAPLAPPLLPELVNS